jgi:hypothetical protein
MNKIDKEPSPMNNNNTPNAMSAMKEAIKSGDYFINNGRVYECIGTDYKMIWYVPEDSDEPKAFDDPGECEKVITPDQGELVAMERRLKDGSIQYEVEAYEKDGDYSDVYCHYRLVKISTASPRWINAAVRLPDLPNPLPPDTEEERGIVFVNRTHSACFIWYPSYGREANGSTHTTPDGHWSLEQWEWLDEDAPAPVPLSSLAPATGRWVKAVERLPEKDYNYFVKATKKHQGYLHNDTALWRNNQWEFLFPSNGSEVVEWLDETPSQQQPAPDIDNLKNGER